MGNIFGGQDESKSETEKPPETVTENTKSTEQETTDSEVQYIVRNIDKLKIGRFQFLNGRLKITPEEDEIFSKLLENASKRTRQLVQKVDRAAGEAVARKFLEQHKNRMTSGVDTTANSVQAPNPLDRDNQAR